MKVIMKTIIKLIVNLSMIKLIHRKINQLVYHLIKDHKLLVMEKKNSKNGMKAVMKNGNYRLLRMKLMSIKNTEEESKKVKV